MRATGSRLQAQVAASAVLWATLLGCGGEPSPSPPMPADCDDVDIGSGADSFVVLPDTQYYSCGYSEIFEAQTDWVAQQGRDGELGIALHTGDIVDMDVAAQWQVASAALHRMDGAIPYVLAPGNHDINASRQSMLDHFFAPEDLSMGGCSTLRLRTPGALANSYAVVELRGTPWLFVGLEFAPRDATLDWASSVLLEHDELPAVIFTHAYLYAEDERYDRAIQPLQRYHPDTYSVTPNEGRADGQDIWETLVEPNENVKVVLSGHVIPDGIARKTSRRTSGTVVHEVLTNFQTCGVCPCEEAQGGGGYLRVFALDETGTSLRVRTYSPYLDMALDDDENAFELEL